MVTLHYTGHPLFDVGLAAITAFVDKDLPEDLTEDDLAHIADYIETYYTEQPLSSFLTVSLMNSDFTQPAYKDNPERKRLYAQRVGRSFGSNIPTGDEVCVFTGLPAMGLPLSLKEGKDALPPGRAYRQHIPLITGEKIINFSPWGDPGLPVSGEALVCLQFFPMGCYKCSGRLLAVHSDNAAVLLYAARKALRENERAISLAKALGETKLPDAPSTAQTLLVDTLLKLDRQQRENRKELQPFSITAYHLTNSGQTSPLDEKSPPVKIYHLPLEIVDFLRMFNHPEYRDAWKELVSRGWELPKPSKSNDSTDASAVTSRRRNYLYEDIFRLPEQARSFVRMYLLRIPRRKAQQNDPRGNYNPRKEIHLVSWQLTEMFLRKVVHMESERIDEISKLGDRLAAYAQKENDKRFFMNFYKVQRYDDFRTLLIRANLKYVKDGKEPLIELNPYLTVFEEGDQLMRPDWRFARDLVLIRMIECLHASHWFDTNPDAFPDDKDIETALPENEQ